MIGLPFLPESPRWLAKVDRTEEAIHILAHIQAGGNLQDPYVVAEFEEIVAVQMAELSAPKGWRKFVYNGMWKRTLVSILLDVKLSLFGSLTISRLVSVCKHGNNYLAQMLWYVISLDTPPKQNIC
jgi:hypothetical protein